MLAAGATVKFDIPQWPREPPDVCSMLEDCYFILNVKVSSKRQRIGSLLNERAQPGASITSLRLNPSRPLKNSELDAVAYDGPAIVLQGAGHVPMLHEPQQGKGFFTVRDLLDAVEKTERDTRHLSEWFGGIDVHHVFFEGFCLEDNVWHICWGS